MLLEKEGKSMVIHEAEVTERDKEQYIVLKLKDDMLNIPITQDLPKEVQKVFNKLIVALKKEMFTFSIAEVKDGDIFYHVAKEYIFQLNVELQDIYNEMKEYGLLESGNTD